MSGTTSALATRNNSAPAQNGTAALAIRSNQSMWDDKQRAALVAMGVNPKATTAELAVFFHQCQKLRLDPFTKQIYLIHRRAKEDGQWVDKPTTQIGIDGFRVTRDRICAERGLSVEYEETIWYDAEGQGFEVWLWDYPPTACKFVVRVDGRRFPSVLRFNEYCQRTRDGELNSMWATKSAHQIEKCAEADGLRRAFPNDLSGVILEDMGPLDDPAAPATLPQDRPRVTADKASARRPQAATAEVIDVQPAEPPARPRQRPDADARGDAARDAMHEIEGEAHRLGIAPDAQLQVISGLVGRPLKTIADITAAEARKVVDTLSAMSPDDLADPDDPDDEQPVQEEVTPDA